MVGFLHHNDIQAIKKANTIISLVSIGNEEHLKQLPAQLNFLAKLSETPKEKLSYFASGVTIRKIDKLLIFIVGDTLQSHNLGFVVDPPIFYQDENDLEYDKAISEFIKAFPSLKNYEKEMGNVLKLIGVPLTKRNIYHRMYYILKGKEWIEKLEKIIKESNIILQYRIVLWDEILAEHVKNEPDSIQLYWKDFLAGKSKYADKITKLRNKFVEKKGKVINRLKENDGTFKYLNEEIVVYPTILKISAKLSFEILKLKTPSDIKWVRFYPAIRVEGMDYMAKKLIEEFEGAKQQKKEPSIPVLPPKHISFMGDSKELYYDEKDLKDNLEIFTASLKKEEDASIKQAFLERLNMILFAINNNDNEDSAAMIQESTRIMEEMLRGSFGNSAKKFN